MQVGYCRLVTISTDNLLETNEFRAGVGAHWPFLADPAPQTSAGSRHRGIHRSAPHKIYNGYWYFGRPTAEELRLDLRAVLQLCRPDSDIGSPEQRAAWANGDKTGFYPYGKTQAQVFGEQD
jgi:hypothetical protein